MCTITATSALISGKAEFRSTDTTRNNKVPPIYRTGKFTYVGEHYAEHDDWIAADPDNTKIVRDEEIHFGGKWMETDRKSTRLNSSHSSVSRMPSSA